MAITGRIQPHTWKPAPTHTPALESEFWAFAELIFDTPAILLGYLYRKVRNDFDVVVKRWRTSRAYDIGNPQKNERKGGS